MAYQMIYGYSGIFRPPVCDLDRRGVSMYCVTTSSKKVLVAIPTVPTFYLDLYNIIKHPQYDKLILVVPSADCMWISDIYNLFGEVRYTLNKKMTVVCPKKLDISTSDAFLDHVVAGRRHVTVSAMINDMEEFTASIDFSSHELPPGRDVFDIILTVPDKKIFFCNYMTVDKCVWLKANPQYYDEVHMPFINRPYGGLGYLDLDRQTCGSMMRKVIVNGLSTTEELELCQLRGIPYGKVRYHDFV